MTGLIWRGGEAVAAMKEGAREKLLVCGEALKQTAISQCPKDSSKLMGSAYLELQGADGVEVGFDRGGTLGYAAAQHERLDYHHPNGGKAKFLEDPFNANAAAYVREIVEAAARAVGADGVV